MPFTQNPLQWKNLMLSIKGRIQETTMQYLQQQLGDWCNQGSLLFQQLQSAPFAAGIINGSGKLNPNAMSSAANTLIGNNTGSTAVDAGLTGAQVTTMLSVTSDLGTVTTNQSVNCLNALLVVIHVAVNATTFTLTYQNLNPGTNIFLFFANVNAASCVVKMAGTTPVLAINAAITGTTVDMVATGTTISTGVRRCFFGAATSTNLWLGFS